LLKGRDTESLYLNSLHYTDQAIGDFIRTAKTRDWWDNTLVVIIADHGSKMPGNSGSDDFLRQHIPMIWLGGALAVHDTVIHTIGSQMDLASRFLTIEHQHGSFLFSKNISLQSQCVCFLYFNEGFGYLT
jgi:phosphoglycerol transferase MdoB-like AlkP superfamily enzyme